MPQLLRNASPETYLVFSALIGLVIAGVVSHIPGVDISFLVLAGIFLSFDVLTYIAMKVGWIRTPRQRSGTDSR
jgi:hypothetical protein